MGQKNDLCIPDTGGREYKDHYSEFRNLLPQSVIFSHNQEESMEALHDLVRAGKDRAPAPGVILPDEKKS